MAAGSSAFAKGKFDLVFNLCEGIDGEAVYEPMVISVLELTRRSLHRQLQLDDRADSAKECRQRSSRSGRTAGAALGPRPTRRRNHERRVPRDLQAGRRGCFGRNRAAIGSAQHAALTARVEAMFEGWDEVLVQRFIDGREVNVGIVGDEVLPIAEIDFAQMPQGMWHIVSYRSKWETGSDEDLGAKPNCPADLPEDLANELAVIARAAWDVVGGEGYGRCDFRIDQSGRPWLLEVNANPDISPNAGLARMAGVAAIELLAI